MIPGTVVSDRELAMPIDEMMRAARLPLVVHSDKQALYEWLAQYMAAEIRAANQEGRTLRWILPVGPKAHYPRLAELTNQEGLSWKQVWCFHMDEFCDWEGRWIPENHPFSFRGYARRELYDRIRPDLSNPPEQVIFPDPARIEEYSAAISAASLSRDLPVAFLASGLACLQAASNSRPESIRSITSARLVSSLIPAIESTSPLFNFRSWHTRSCASVSDVA